MSDEDKDYTAASKAVISRKQREIEKTRDKLEAFESELKRAHKGFLKDEEHLNAVRQEILNGVRGRATGNTALAEKAKRLGGEGQIFIDEHVTGYAEAENPYWSKDDE